MSTSVNMTSDQSSLAKTASKSLSEGKLTLAEIWELLDSASITSPSAEVVRVPPKPLPITPEQSAALTRLPEIYGQVAPTENRALTLEEQSLIVEERGLIDSILGFIKKRKDESIREIIANHLDHALLSQMSAEEIARLPIDKKGHYQTKQEVSVEGTGKKFQKTVSNPKPVLSMAAVEQAHRDGLLTREQYLSITRLPEVPRVLDEAKMASAVKKDPSLLFLLSTLTERPDGTTTIKVEKDNQ